VQTGASDRLVRPWQDVDQAWQDYAEQFITAKNHPIRVRRPRQAP
jgi:hypothetical protein